MEGLVAIMATAIALYHGHHLELDWWGLHCSSLADSRIAREINYEVNAAAIQLQRSVWERDVGELSSTLSSFLL